MYKRPIYQTIIERLGEPRVFIQVLTGPRQVGKTTLAHQIKNSIPIPSHYATADEPTLRSFVWLEGQWEIARLKAKENNTAGALLILDEIQKIPEWSNLVKKLWDDDSANGINLKVIILGSSTLLIQSGLSDSLAGRFELIPVFHWSFEECKQAFGLTLDQYIYFGGYPGPVSLIKHESRWLRYINDSIIETSISRDIMLMKRIYKPALLRRIFELGCQHSGEVLSYQQMIGHLREVGNAQTVALYLNMLAIAGFVCGLPKFSGGELRQKASSPKLQVLNTALTSALSHLTFKAAKQNADFWDRLEESTVGAHLLNLTFGTNIKVFYWKEGNKEIPFLLQRGESLLALEIKGERKKFITSGLEAFSLKFPATKKLMIGHAGMPIEEFLLIHPEDLF